MHIVYKYRTIHNKTLLLQSSPHFGPKRARLTAHLQWGQTEDTTCEDGLWFCLYNAGNTNLHNSYTYVILKIIIRKKKYFFEMRAHLHLWE